MSRKTVQTLEYPTRLANVFMSAISRALNNRPLLHQETKEPCQAIAQVQYFRIHACGCPSDCAQAIWKPLSRSVAAKEDPTDPDLMQAIWLKTR
jgi:hypothetical protein